jgi:5-methylcytosine-specific restriction protein A
MAKAFDAITPEHIWQAAQMLAAGEAHPFGEPHDFALIADGDVRLAPKAVFGTATRLALGVEIRPEHFAGGLASRSHRMLERAGYEIVERGARPAAAIVPMSNEDREWTEGRPRLVTHLRRERAPGLAKAKKSAFVREHGRLSCERCGLDPVMVFGTDVGEACIEVHHDRIALARMGNDHVTSLDDLQCLCANCHRVVHAMLREESR